MESSARLRWNEQPATGIAVTWFCLVCFTEAHEEQARCRNCRNPLTALDADAVDDVLGRTLRQGLAMRRLLAAYLLNERRRPSTVPILSDPAQHDDDPSVAAQAVRALARIGTDDALSVVRTVATSGPVVPRRAARDALAYAGSVGEP
jgi:hypothetical protein